MVSIAQTTINEISHVSFFSESRVANTILDKSLHKKWCCSEADRALLPLLSDASSIPSSYSLLACFLFSFVCSTAVGCTSTFVYDG